MWSTYLYKTITGQLGPKINPSSQSWNIELNGTESISLTLRKSDLPNIDLTTWLSPWWAGVVVFWNDTPIVAGPILARPSESFEDVTISCGGIRSVLAKRTVNDEFVNWDLLPKEGRVSFSNYGLGTIAKKVVQRVQQKPGGILPISYALADEQAGHERNYEGFNVSNLNCDDVLTKLSNVINGPDIMFKPRLLRPGILTFEMWTGTEAQPRIQQKYRPVWDTTASTGLVSGMNVVYTGTYMVSRVYAIGPGQDQGTMIKVVTDTGPLSRDYPMLEGTLSTGSSENPDVVTSHGLSNLEANNGPLTELQMTVRADGTTPIGDFWPGDLVEVVTKGWLSLPDGKLQMRLLSITGDHTNNVKISLQKEDKFA